MTTLDLVRDRLAGDGWRLCPGPRGALALLRTDPDAWIDWHARGAASGQAVSELHAHEPLVLAYLDHGPINESPPWQPPLTGVVL